jgi:predicted Zn-dependent peptidase
MILPPPNMPPPLVLVDPTSSVVTFQTIVRLPNLSPQEAAAVEVLARVMTTQTGDFTPGKVNLIMAGSGDRLRGSLMPDHMRFSFSVPKADESLGFSLLTSMIRSPYVSDETVAAARTAIISEERAQWQLVIAPEIGDISHVRTQDVLRVYANLVRPENLTVGVGGDVDEASVDAAYGKRMGDWAPPKPPRSQPDYRNPGPQPPNTSRYSVVSLSGVVFGAKDAAFPARLLAAFALGSGKGASVFRVVREQLGLSYMQECEVEGVPGGLRLDAWWAQEDKESSLEHAKVATSALQADVSAWTEADRVRALAIAESVLLRGLDVSPFFFQATGPVGGSIQDRTFLDAYWQMKTGGPWDARAILESLRKVDLAALKAEAAGFLTGATPRLFPGG